MANGQDERKLTAILAADVVGYYSGVEHYLGSRVRGTQDLAKSVGNSFPVFGDVRERRNRCIITVIDLVWPSAA